MSRAWLVAAVAAAACGAPSTTAFNSKAELAGAPRIERLVVLADIAVEDFNTRLFYGFRSTMESVLAQCGVTGRVVQGRVADDSPPPTATLTLTLTQRSVHMEQRNAAPGILLKPELSGEDLVFAFELLDLSTAKRTWLAKAEFRYKVGQTVDAGSAFALAVLTRLRDDGVLPGCPRGELKRPFGS